MRMVTILAEVPTNLTRLSFFRKIFATTRPVAAVVTMIARDASAGGANGFPSFPPAGFLAMPSQDTKATPPKKEPRRYNQNYMTRTLVTCSGRRIMSPDKVKSTSDDHQAWPTSRKCKCTYLSYPERDILFQDYLSVDASEG